MALDALAVEPGAVMVLGERHGRIEDLDRARSLIEEAASRGAVTVALEAVSADHQDVMDQLTAGQIRAGKVRRSVNWSETWGYPFKAYKALFKIQGVRYVAAGPKLGPKPADVEVPVPEVYEERLAGIAAAHHHGGNHPEATRKFAEAMAWRDYEIARLAVDAWDGTSPLVVVAGRGHVEGGLGITWQLDAGLSDAPHQRVLLAPSRQCEAGDLVLGADASG
ncbi:MAG: ChaN family lipoprotein [Myxococcota bacterium]